MHVDWTGRGLRRKLARRYQQYQIQKRIRRFNPGGYQRIYFYHCRKTAGTSLVKMFMSLGGLDGNAVYRKLETQSDRLLIAGDMVFTGWNPDLIAAGEYCFGFSHVSYDDLNLPQSTYCLTTFRDPLDRLLSHYRMLSDYSRQENPHCCFADEGPWLGNSFDDFLERIPPVHLLNQLYMFSKRLDIAEAVERIRSLQHVSYFNTFAKSIEQLNRDIGCNLAVRHDHKSKHTMQLTDRQRDRVYQMLEPEYRMLEILSKVEQRQAA